MAPSRGLTLDLATGQSVSGLVTAAPNAFACLVLAHGAGAGMHHRFMAAIADGLAERGVAMLRYQFPYMETGAKRVDKPEIAHAAVRAAVAAAAGPLPLFAGGKSFGARMTSQAQAIDALPDVRGLAFFGFPLHPAETRFLALVSKLVKTRGKAGPIARRMHEESLSKNYESSLNMRNLRNCFVRCGISLEWRATVSSGRNQEPASCG